MLPIEEIKDGHAFQQIVAEYFRSLKSEKHDFQIADIHVEDNGVGGDDGCDILVEFHFEDVIGKHSHRWVIECKAQKRAVGSKDINLNNLDAILKSKLADGYLLICMHDASTSLKRILASMNSNGTSKYVVWNGSELWHKVIKREGLLKAFFPNYYQRYFVNNNAKNDYNDLVQEFELKLKARKRK